MAALGSKLRTLAGNQIGFFCPGCNNMHAVGVGEGAGPRWGFNGDGDKPTITPSILVHGVRRLTDAEYTRVMRGEAFEPEPFVCHSFVTAGRIQFLADSSHALAGETVDLPDFDPFDPRAS